MKNTKTKTIIKQKRPFRAFTVSVHFILFFIGFVSRHVEWAMTLFDSSKVGLPPSLRCFFASLVRGFLSARQSRDLSVCPVI
jgi:predicted small integral membrane protein